MPLTSPERRRLCHVLPVRSATPVASWVATLPPGTTGTAKQLLPVFLASPWPVDRVSAPRTPVALGLALTRLLGRGVSRTLRSGTSTWMLTPSGASAPLAMPSA